MSLNLESNPSQFRNLFYDNKGFTHLLGLEFFSETDQQGVIFESNSKDENVQAYVLNVRNYHFIPKIFSKLSSMYLCANEYDEYIVICTGILKDNTRSISSFIDRCMPHSCSSNNPFVSFSTATLLESVLTECHNNSVKLINTKKYFVDYNVEHSNTFNAIVINGYVNIREHLYINKEDLIKDIKNFSSIFEVDYLSACKRYSIVGAKRK